MKKKHTSRARGGIIGVLDIGTTKMCCFIARVEGKHPRIIGIGHQVSRGVKHGIVTDIEAASQSILDHRPRRRADGGRAAGRGGGQPVGGLRRLAHGQGRDQPQRPRNQRPQHAPRARTGLPRQGAARAHGDPFRAGRILDRRQPRRSATRAACSATSSASTCTSSPPMSAAVRNLANTHRALPARDRGAGREPLRLGPRLPGRGRERAGRDRHRHGRRHHHHRRVLRRQSGLHRQRPGRRRPRHQRHRPRACRRRSPMPSG